MMMGGDGKTRTNKKFDLSVLSNGITFFVIAFDDSVVILSLQLFCKNQCTVYTITGMMMISAP